MAKGKGVVVEVNEALNAAEKEESLVFNPPASVIPDNVGLMEYQMHYNGRIGDDIEVTLAPRKVDFTKTPKVGEACTSPPKF